MLQKRAEDFGKPTGRILCHELKFSDGSRFFLAGRDSVKDEPRPRRPTSKTDENVERVKSLRPDRCLTVRLIAEQLNLNKSTVDHVLTNDLEIRKISATLVPKTLIVQQKDNKKDVCTGIIKRTEHDPDFLRKVITGR